jgi:rare lipoprotein A
LTPHVFARGRGQTKVALGACVIATGAALAASTPAHGASGGTTFEPPAAATNARVSVTRHVRRGNAVRVKGALGRRYRRRVVRLQRRTRDGWETIDTARAGRRGGFRASWTPRRAGTVRLRIRFRASRRYGTAAAKRLPRVYVYRRAMATWYGPGLYGNRTACGQTLTRETTGVAHKTLPCGTRIRFRFRGRSAVAKVIDRGPFRAGYDWDLTSALKDKLGFDSSGALWSSR